MKFSKVKLANAMIKKGLNISDLVTLSGVSRATVSAVYNGKSCSLAVAVKISKALEVEFIEIAEERG